MALATVADVVDRLGRDLTTAETSRVDGLLEEASALVIGHLGYDPTDTSVDPPVVPGPVTLVVSRMVARLFEREAAAQVSVGAESVTEQTGPFGRTLRYGVGTTSGNPWLVRGDKVILRPYANVTLGISSGRTGSYRRQL